MAALLARREHYRTLSAVMRGDRNSMLLKAVDLLVNIAHSLTPTRSSVVAIRRRFLARKSFESNWVFAAVGMKSSLPDYTSAAYLLVSGNPAQTNDV
jgi:hypothetical protein